MINSQSKRHVSITSSSICWMFFIDSGSFRSYILPTPGLMVLTLFGSMLLTMAKIIWSALYSAACFLASYGSVKTHREPSGIRSSWAIWRTMLFM